MPPRREGEAENNANTTAAVGVPDQGPIQKHEAAAAAVAAAAPLRPPIN